MARRPCSATTWSVTRSCGPTRTPSASTACRSPRTARASTCRAASWQVLWTVAFTGPDASRTDGPSAPSHGISLSPDERELYVVDWPDYVHVFDVSGVPGRAPAQVADIALTPSMNHQESPCLYD